MSLHDIAALVMLAGFIIQTFEVFLCVSLRISATSALRAPFER